MPSSNKRYKQPSKVRIDSFSHDGHGVAHVDGKAVFISGALAGEYVLFQYTRRHRRYDEGKIIEVLEASDQRVMPKCTYFGICGGCQLQHLSSRTQLSVKQDIVMDNLQRIGEVTPKTILAPLQAETWGYRTRARLGARYVEKKQKLLVGFREQKSSFVTDMHTCEVLNPKVGQRLKTLANLLDGLSIKKQIPQIEVAVGHNSIALVFRVLQPLNDSDINQLKLFSEEYKFDIYIQPDGIDSTYLLASNSGVPLSYLLDNDIEIRFQPHDFTQVNQSINRLMVEQAVELMHLESNDKVLDLFCGLGNFTLPIAKRVQHAVGVEFSVELIERAKHNAVLNNIDGVEFYPCDLAKPLQHQESWMQDNFNKVLIDPPRTGAKDVIPFIAKIKPELVLYISCNPGTLARDAGELVNTFNYRFESAGVVDMFPHTSHIECMALFKRE